METLAYLHEVEATESEAKELNLGGLKAVALTGLVAAGVTTAGVVGQADSASAYHCGGGGCFRRVYYRPIVRCCYQRVYFRPCRSSCCY
jgi:hypothetical protein